MKKFPTWTGKGIAAFELVSDDNNLALLHSNMGRLMRLRASYTLVHDYSPNDYSSNGKPDERGGKYNKQALDHYTSAIAVLGSRKRNTVIWDTIMWELSSTLYSLAVLSQVRLKNIYIMLDFFFR